MPFSTKVSHGICTFILRVAFLNRNCNKFALMSSYHQVCSFMVLYQCFFHDISGSLAYLTAATHCLQEESETIKTEFNLDSAKVRDA